MRRLVICNLIAAILFSFMSCSSSKKDMSDQQPVYTDQPFQQEFAIKYDWPKDQGTLEQVYCDRNGVIQIYSSVGLLKTFAGAFLYPGSLVPDNTYLPMADKSISALSLYQEHFIYLDAKAVISNDWAGNLFSKYDLPKANLFVGGNDFAFMLSDGFRIQYLKNSTILWKGESKHKIIDILFNETDNNFWLLGSETISVFSVADQTLNPVFTGKDFTCFALSKNNKELVVGTTNGYLILDTNTKNQIGELKQKLPATHITAVQEINNRLWFGTTKGAFKINDNGTCGYYASKRWLPSDVVVDINEGPEQSVLILTNEGLGQIQTKSITLEEKAEYFEKQVRSRHIRHGFNATLGKIQHGNFSTGTLEDSDNDGLWTSMYLAAEVFRYAVTKSDDALQNIKESMTAMERLYTINGVKGFPSRSFERHGYKEGDKPWRKANDPEWDWKSTTSSDEAIGHIFVFGVMAEILTDQSDLQSRAIVLIDSLMQHTIDHNYYLVDWNGEPTVWGKWNPDYVNARPVGVGDRKINSSNYISMLQTAYHFTHKEIYKEKAFELMTTHGYFDNLMLPMSQVRTADDNADDWSKMLSESWNHSDDEMYFLGYWGLYRYAFNDTLKARFKEAIIDHWQIERPEKDGAWNIITALTNTNAFDLNEAIWYLQEFPLDLIHWQITNSQRQDIDMLAPNFRNQTIKEVLPPDELPVSRHNANRFTLDGGDNGSSEYSAGDIWLMPYWMGRYLKVISAPVEDHPDQD